MRHRLARRLLAVVVLCGLAGVVGCKSRETKAREAEARRLLGVTQFEVLPPREVPQWMRGTIYEQTDLANTEPMRMSNYGLVVNLRRTGDTAAPSQVREYILREMAKRGVGSANNIGFEDVNPEAVLRDPRVAIVRVDSFIPPAAVRGQRIDVQVTALEENNTSSLAGGMLYLTDLYQNGANPQNPGGIDPGVRARGSILVNPAYALDPDLTSPAQRLSLRSGVILGGGLVNRDRPLALRIRTADARTARMTEFRIDQAFNDGEVASAQNEAVVFIRMPARFRGDWERFANVVLHTFYFDDDALNARKALELAEEAQKPDAMLSNLSWAFEALGEDALPAIQPLYSNANPAVAFAAARAGAYIGDASAEAALFTMAQTAGNAFRLNAISTLGSLEPSPQITRQLRQLLNAPEALVRVEAYRMLVKNKDTSIFSKTIGDRFILDIVQSDQPPVIYASRTLTPRIAIIGRRAELKLPVLFTAMDHQFSLSTLDQAKRHVTVFYRGADVFEPIQIRSTTDIAELVARLGGEGPAGQRSLPFDYTSVVSILGKLSDQGLIVNADGAPGQVAFVVQELGGFDAGLLDAPAEDAPRPITREGVSDASRR